MLAFDYANAPCPVREDIPRAYRAYWEQLASAGTWWTGAERVAIAQEVRNATACDYCRARKQALSPYQFPGEHTHSGNLPYVVVDAVHRVITDQGRITGDWVREIAGEGLSEEKYVELVGIAVTVFSIDEFNRGIGMPPEPLPQPLSGEPERYRPDGLEQGTGFVSMIAAGTRLSGRERGLWPGGRAANVLRALSLVPDTVHQWKGVAGVQYLTDDKVISITADTGRSINRMQMEVIAGRVSSINECFY